MPEPKLVLKLTDSLGRPVLDAGGGRVGRVDDLAIALDDAYPPVRRLVVRGDRGSRTSFPWSAVASYGPAQVELFGEGTGGVAVRLGDELLLAKDVLDHQIFDLGGRRLTRVGDAELAPEDGLLRVIAVEVGVAPILRRLGLRRLGDRVRTRALDWRDLHLLSPRGHTLQLETRTAGVQRLDAAGLAELIRRLPPARGEMVLHNVHPEKATAVKEALASRPRRRRLFDLLRTRKRAAP